MQVNYEDLANAIIYQAVKDYRKACRRLKRNPKRLDAQAMKTDCEEFFRSKWYKDLTSIDGEELMMIIQREGIA